MVCQSLVGLDVRSVHGSWRNRASIGGGKAAPTAVDLRAGFIHNGRPLAEPVEGCAAEIVMDRAIPFIRNASNEGQPFLAVIWFNPPHTPVVGHPKYMSELYSDLPETQQHYYSLATAIDARWGDCVRNARSWDRGKYPADFHQRQRSRTSDLAQEKPSRPPARDLRGLSGNERLRSTKAASANRD